MKKLVTFSDSSFLMGAILFTLIFSFSSVLIAQNIEKKDHRYGGYARLFSMGDNPYVVDPDNIKLNPAYASMYSNFLWGDIGSNNGIPTDGNGQFAGVNFALNNNLTLGLLLARDDFQSMSIARLDRDNIVNNINTTVGSAVIVPLNNNLELLGAYKFGNFVVGLGVSYASTSREVTPATGTGDKGTASQIGANLGLMGKVAPGFEFDFSFSLLLPSATFEPGTAGADKISGSNTFMYANARAMVELSKKFTFVPTVDFFNGSGKVEVGANSTDLPSELAFGVGLGLQYKVDNLIIVGGPAFMYSSQSQASTTTTPELKNSTMTFPAWNLGAEWGFTEWLYGRLGYVASTFSRTTQSPVTATTVDELSFTGFGNGDVRLGLGFRFGGFNLDATINDDVLREGFNLVGGGTRTFAYISASYGF